jgi:hypothetical protein
MQSARTDTTPRKGESWGVRLFLGLRLHCLRQSVRAQSGDDDADQPPVLVVEDVH